MTRNLADIGPEGCRQVVTCPSRKLKMSIQTRGVDPGAGGHDPLKICRRGQSMF